MRRASDHFHTYHEKRTCFGMQAENLEVNLAKLVVRPDINASNPSENMAQAIVEDGSLAMHGLEVATYLSNQDQVSSSTAPEIL